ncbi:hypothetical protein Stsp01_33360 [Streptomyces sp. NBRC 13847]|nr:hypothetical protein Stsp01_33360 [Streptomyces sp. NBRC 13847]
MEQYGRTVGGRGVHPDEGGLHAGAAHIKGDDVSHGNSFARSGLKGLVHSPDGSRPAGRPEAGAQG